LFEFNSVSAIVGGSATTLADLTFYSMGEAGGFSDAVHFNLIGPQLYAGPESSPTFVLGVYPGMFDESNLHTDTLTLTALSAVPEPSTWTLMLPGFVGLGFAAWRGKTSGVGLLSRQTPPCS
jgi:PEP-CTERM motif